MTTPRLLGCGGRAGRFALGGLLLTLLPLAHGLGSWVADGEPTCLFRLATHRPCVFCGLTRAFGAVANSDWGLAWRLNPLWPLAVLATAVAGGVCLLDAASGFDRLTRWAPSPFRTRWIVAGVVGASLTRALLQGPAGW